MANEISVVSTSGTTVYAVVRDSHARPWNTGTSALESYTQSNWAGYALALSEQGTSGVFVGTFPVALSVPGVYSVEARAQAGGSPAPSDTVLASGSLVWTGTQEAFVTSNGSGQVQHDLGQAVPTSNTAQTVGDALCAARAQGFGAWRISGTTLTLYAPDGTTAVRTFALDSPTSPSTRS